MKAISIQISDEAYQYARQNKINLSQSAREGIDRAIERDKKIKELNL